MKTFPGSSILTRPARELETGGEKRAAGGQLPGRSGNESRSRSQAAVRLAHPLTPKAILPGVRFSLHFGESIYRGVGHGRLPMHTGLEGSYVTAEGMYSTTFIMIAATLAVLFTWVFCEYSVEAVRVLRVMAQEDELRSQQALDVQPAVDERRAV